MSLRILRWIALVPIAVIILSLAVSSQSGEAGGGITTQSLAQGLTAGDLVTSLVGGGVTTSNVTYSGAQVAAGTFSGGAGIVGFDSGVILSSGDIGFVVGPNQFGAVTGVNNTPGDANLDALSGFTTEDAAILEFDFVPASDVALFRFVFGSDEYNEFVNSEYNDVFAFYVNGANCALVPNTSTPITINTINNGNPFGTPPVSNPTLYRNNDAQPGPLDTEMDGLTVVLTCLAAVNADVNNHIKLAIADASDAFLDSVVFLQANSLVGSGPGDTDCSSTISSVDALFVLRATAGLPVSAQCIANGDVNCSGGLNSVDALLILRFSAGLPITGLPPGCPPIGGGPPPTASPTATPGPLPQTLQVGIDDDVFESTLLGLNAGVPFQIDLTNNGSNTHNMHVDGADHSFDTLDDLVSAFIDGGGTGQLDGPALSAGTYDFRCDVHPITMTGAIDVT